MLWYSKYAASLLNSQTIIVIMLIILVPISHGLSHFIIHINHTRRANSYFKTLKYAVDPPTYFKMGNRQGLTSFNIVFICMFRLVPYSGYGSHRLVCSLYTLRSVCACWSFRFILSLILYPNYWYLWTVTTFICPCLIFFQWWLFDVFLPRFYRVFFGH